MAIKEILIILPTYPDAPPVRTMESACYLAQVLGAKITGLIPQLSEDVSTWPALIGTFPLDFPRLMDEAVHGSERNAQRLTEEITKVASDYRVGLDVRRSLTVLYGTADPLVDLARLHDLAILPIPEINGFDRNYLEPVLFGSGHPTLLLPSGKGHRPLRQLENVVVAWDFGREAARALSDALPILTKAKRVHIFSVLGEKQLAHHLREPAIWRSISAPTALNTGWKRRLSQRAPWANVWRPRSQRRMRICWSWVPMVTRDFVNLCWVVRRAACSRIRPSPYSYPIRGSGDDQGIGTGRMSGNLVG